MHPARRVPFVPAVIAAFAAAAALGLSGCGAGVPAASSDGVSAAAASAPSESAGATSAPAPAAPTADGAPPSSSAPASSDVKTYTFPDGRLSFKYPADWRVDLFTGAGEPSLSRTATVFDASGTEQVTVYSGQVADAVSHRVSRTVFQTEPVPGLSQQPAPSAHYSFYVERMDGIAAYRMDLTPGEPKAGDDDRVNGIIRIGDEVLIAEVRFIERPFGSDEAAKTWLEGAEGQALKALLLSISYT